MRNPQAPFVTEVQSTISNLRSVNAHLKLPFMMESFAELAIYRTSGIMTSLNVKLAQMDSISTQV